MRDAHDVFGKHLLKERNSLFAALPLDVVNDLLGFGVIPLERKLVQRVI
jgi:hypothetical protein